MFWEILFILVCLCLKLCLLVLSSRVGCLSQGGAWHHTLIVPLGWKALGAVVLDAMPVVLLAGTVEVALVAAVVAVVGNTVGRALEVAPGA